VGQNTIPLTYVDNCAEAIALAGLRRGVDGDVFNIVDDDLPTSRQFLRLYKKHVKHFASLLCSPRCKLCSLLPMGVVFELVGGPVAAIV